MVSQQATGSLISYREVNEGTMFLLLYSSTPAKPQDPFLDFKRRSRHLDYFMTS